MSRLARERWVLGNERWPKLQQFLSQELADQLFGSTKVLHGAVLAKLSDIKFSDQTDIAKECWDFLAYFEGRFDDSGFLRDGFGIAGKTPFDARGKGHQALFRIKLVYDIFVEQIRTVEPNWKPTTEKTG